MSDARGRGRRQALRTKIVATLGPASAEAGKIRRLIKAGVNVFRINFSHGDLRQHERTIREVRTQAARLDRPVAVLADLQGPKIRVGALRDHQPILLKRGSRFTIVAADIVGQSDRVGCTYPSLARDVSPGERILLDDGNLEVKVTAVSGNEVHTVVVTGGILREHKGINLPGTELHSPSFTRKDQGDLTFALEHDVDFIALSFVSSADDVRRVRERTRKAGSSVEIIAKIERPDAVRNIEAILDASDGIMIARGDMGVELGPEAVPPIQKHLIHRCVAAAKPVITATQMLESMVENPRPTRAEASDVANAVYDRSSALMLSAETAAGKHPVLAVRTMRRIARRAERDIFRRPRSAAHRRLSDRGEPLSISEATVAAAARAALQTHARAIVVFTESGRTAKLVARERLPLRIFGCTASDGTLRRLALQWGITPVRNRRGRSVAALRQDTERLLLEHRYLSPGDRVVFIAGLVDVVGATNTIHIVDVGAPRE